MLYIFTNNLLPVLLQLCCIYNILPKSGNVAYYLQLCCMYIDTFLMGKVLFLP